MRVAARATRRQLGLNLSGLLSGGLGLLDLSLGLLLNAHEDDDGGADITVDGDGDLVSTGNLDGLAELDALAVDVHVELSLDRVGNHGSGDGTKEDALLADLGVDGDLLAIELGLEGLGVGQTNGLALLDVVTTLLELLEVTLGGSNGELLRNQVVLGVTLSDVDDVTLAALALDLTKQNNFMGTLLLLLARTAGGHHGHGVRQESHLAGALDGVRDVVLMLRAGASDAARLDLAAVGHVLAKELSILVVDVLSASLQNWQYLRRG